MIDRHTAGAAGVAALFALAGCASGGGSSGSPGSPALVAASQSCEALRDAVDISQFDNFSFRFADAGDRLADIIAVYGQGSTAPERCAGSDLPTRSYLLANRALALSNQRQFLLAERLFAEAERALVEDAPIDERIAIEAFRLQAALNRGESPERVETAMARFRALADSPEASALLRSDALEAGGTVAFDRAARRQMVGVASGSYASSAAATAAGRGEEALSAVDRAIEEIDRIEGIGEGYAPRFLTQRASILLDLRRLPEARAEAEGALASMARLFGGTPLEARALMTLARIQAAQGEDEGALQTYERAFSIYRENTSILSYNSVWPFFDLAQRIAERRPERRAEMAQKMFGASLVIRSPVAAKAISTAATAATIDPQVALLVRDLTVAEEAYRLAAVREILSETDGLGGAGGDDLSAEVARARGQLDAARAALGIGSATPPSEAAARYLAAVSAPIPLARLQAALEPGEALLRIVPGEPRGVIFVVSKTGIEATMTGEFPRRFRLLNGDTLGGGPDNMARALLSGIQRSANDGELYPFRVDIARTAYETLIEPVEASIAPYDSLVVSVAGGLSAVPFEMLIDREVDEAALDAALIDQDYSGISWFGAGRRISYVPAPRNLADLRQLSPRAPVPGVDPMLVLTGYQGVRPADAEREVRALLAANAPGGASGVDDTCVEIARGVIEGLGAIDATGAGGRALATALGGKASVVSGPDFTQSDLEALRTSLGDRRIVHFNTHGLLWGTPDCFVEPALTVNPVALGDEPGIDRLMTASEFQRLGIDADLVVLAACETAGADILAGDSLSGLARSFFLGGARAVVASHWAVEDEATAVLMEKMYDALDATDGISFQGALREAQGDLRGVPETSHPFFWAPFVMIGDGTAGLGI